MNLFPNDSFRPALDSPLYQQLYAHIRAAILTGKLKPGRKLPSSRTLAQQLNLSRNTVLNTYNQLISEGYLESKSGSGTFVAQVLPEHLLNTSAQAPFPPIPQDPTQDSLETPATRRGFPRPFLAEMPALDAFPYKLWSRLIVRQARRMPVSAFTYQDSAGYLPLREAIAAHVSLTRQVRCMPEQILIVSGSQGGLDLAARVLIRSGDPAWVEDPGYPGARGALLSAGARLVPVPVDSDGLVVAEGIAREPQARLVYLTPSHQFPLGMTMSLGRRLSLLDWAQQAGAYLLEDDYDSEYRYVGRPLAALQGLDEAGRVVYLGTFSKVLFPSLRIGYLILPPHLVDSFLKARRKIDLHNPMLEQLVLTDFLVEGHFNRHLRRMRALYAERRSALIAALEGLPLTIDAPEAGIHCIAWLPEGVPAQPVIQAAAAQGVGLTPISTFCLQPLTRQGFLLSYGGYSVQEIREAAGRLAKALDSISSL